VTLFIVTWKIPSTVVTSQALIAVVHNRLQHCVSQLYHKSNTMGHSHCVCKLVFPHKSKPNTRSLNGKIHIVTAFVRSYNLHELCWTGEACPGLFACTFVLTAVSVNSFPLSLPLIFIIATFSQLLKHQYLFFHEGVLERKQVPVCVCVSVCVCACVCV